MVPEVPVDINGVIEKIKKTQKTGKEHFIIVVAEGVGGVEDIAKQIEDATGIESRATILGHVQRGGNPSVRDRVIATMMGSAAVELLDKGIGNRVICKRGNEITDMDIFEALNMKKNLNLDMLNVANCTSI